MSGEGVTPVVGRVEVGKRDEVRWRQERDEMRWRQLCELPWMNFEKIIYSCTREADT